MATFVWTWQGTTDQTIGTANVIQFNDGTFDNPITVGAYNDGTMIASAGGGGQTNLTSGKAPHNNKYLTASTISIDGAGSTALNVTSEANCGLKIVFSDTASVTTSSVTFYAFDGGTPTTDAPVGVTFQCAEETTGSKDATWTNADGSGSAVTLVGQGPGTAHTWYIALSASPDSVGLKSSFALGVSLTYT